MYTEQIDMLSEWWVLHDLGVGMLGLIVVMMLVRLADALDSRGRYKDHYDDDDE